MPLETPRTTRARYHHGDLAPALLLASEAELEEQGIEGFSIRGVAKRIGVSHTALKPHFGDTRGLLTALAAGGFDRLLAAQRAKQRESSPQPAAQLVALGLAYVDFAERHPALFRLMFASERPDQGAPALQTAAAAAFRHLALTARAAGRARGRRPASIDVLAAWAVAHGLADLLIAGRLEKFEANTPQNMRKLINRTLRRIALV